MLQSVVVILPETYNDTYGNTVVNGWIVIGLFPEASVVLFYQFQRSQWQLVLQKMQTRAGLKERKGVVKMWCRRVDAGDR